ncbi:MAG: response regulator [bacterium]|nr:response regulator [bacterium]
MSELKILVVDDELDERTWMTAFFEDNGYATDSAVDGEEGLAKARAGGVDLITLDITMDNQSGVKMFKNLQDTPETTGIPVIMVTGVAKEFRSFIERTRQVKNPDGYFEKPVDQDALLTRVRELIG